MKVSSVNFFVNDINCNGKTKFEQIFSYNLRYAEGYKYTGNQYSTD